MPKLLGEFLQEQQEPFALDVYLLERGYYHKIPNNISPNYILRRFLKKERYSIPNCSHFLKAAFGRLVSTRKTKNSANGDQIFHNKNREEERVEKGSLSSSSGNIGFNSSDREDTQKPSQNDNVLLEEGGDADRNLKRERVENQDKQLSPVSVLEETDSGEASTLEYRKHTIIIRNTGQGEASTSIPPCELKRGTHDVQEFGGTTNTCSQYIVNKRVLRQTKQLLIDCVREVIENHKKRDKRKDQLNKILGADELWKLVCENVRLWSQHPIDETNVIGLLRFDYMEYSAEECNGDDGSGIFMELADAILEDLVSEI